MDIVLIELVLWAGLIIFLWVLKDTLGKFESEIDQTAPNKPEAAPRPGLVEPDRLYEPIGSYGGATIFRYAVIDGKQYEFDYATSEGPGLRLGADQRFIAPGLVYSASPLPPGGNLLH
jgi:hypothetical protein